MTDQTQPAEIGVIGGTGFYELLTDTEHVDIDTPYGAPSHTVAIGVGGGRRIAFLPRHGLGHRFPPHEINYRANLWALRSLGVRQILAPCAVGSLRPELGPGSIVVPDQVVDRTSGRVQTYYDTGAVHVPFADPYCEEGRTSVLKAASRVGIEGHDGGTMVVVQGPRFSSRAESQWYAQAGWSLVNMTGVPEAVLSRELGLCYTAVALVTDHDAGIAAGKSVDQETVFQVFNENIQRLRSVILEAVRLLPKQRTCRCASALEGLPLPFELP